MKKMCLPLMILTMLLISHASVNARDNGKIWLSLSEEVHGWYAMGYVRGYWWGYYTGVGDAKIPPNKRPSSLKGGMLKTEGIYRLDPAVIGDTMTQLYQDPANRLIGIELICRIAIDKLMGMDKETIEKTLEWARKKATESPGAGQ